MNTRITATLLLALAFLVPACGGGSAGVSPAKLPVADDKPAEPSSTTATSSAPASAADAKGEDAAKPAEPPKAAKADGAPAAAEADPPKKIGARHVLVQYMGSERAPAAVVRTREQARSVAEEVLKRARAGEELTRLAVEYSDEPGAGGRGGSLGRFGRGQMVGAFEEVAFKLKVGEVSGIVETPFGFHVIQRTE